MGDKIEPINYSYFIASIILLIICYYFLKSTQSQLHEKNLIENDTQQKTIKVRTAKGEICMDPNIFEMHMNRMKDNIMELNTQFSDKECGELKKYLDKTKNNTSEYININTNHLHLPSIGHNSDFCDKNKQSKLINDVILEKRELLKHKLDSTIKNTDSTKTDTIQHSILELLIDIDIILLLVKSSMCKNGKLDFSLIDTMMLELYKNKCSNIQPNIQKNNEYKLNLEVPNLTNEGFTPEPAFRKLDGDQNSVVDYEYLYKNNSTIKPTDNKSRVKQIYDNKSVSHNINKDFIDTEPKIIATFPKQSYKFLNPILTLNNIDMQSINRELIDYDSRTSLAS
jgi:hypothetical protein